LPRTVPHGHSPSASSSRGEERPGSPPKRSRRRGRLALSPLFAPDETPLDAGLEASLLRLIDAEAARERAERELHEQRRDIAAILADLPVGSITRDTAWVLYWLTSTPAQAIAAKLDVVTRTLAHHLAPAPTEVADGTIRLQPDSAVAG
jgi:hypothetical protein